MIPSDDVARVKMRIIRDGCEWYFGVNLPRIDDLKVWADRIESRFETVKNSRGTKTNGR
jgi:hypothetical protein